MCVCASRGHYRAAKVATLKLGKKPKGCERERWRDGEKKKKKNQRRTTRCIIRSVLLISPSQGE